MLLFHFFIKSCYRFPIPLTKAQVKPMTVEVLGTSSQIKPFKQAPTMVN